MSQPKFRVAICGGGIGGLTLAVVLGKYSHDVQIDIYESAAQFVAIGAGISVWSRTWRIFQLLGLDVALGRMAVRPPAEGNQQGFVFRKGNQADEGVNFYDLVLPYGTVTVHRADLLKVLTDSLPGTVTVHFAKRLESFMEEPSGPIRLKFADGTEVETDVLVGADGVRSATRATLYRRAAASAAPDQAERLLAFVEPAWSGTFAYRALINTERLKSVDPSHRTATTPTMYFGKDQHVITYPISQGQLVNVIGYVTVPDGEGMKFDGPSVQDASRDELLGHFKGWEPEVRTLFQCVDKASRWAVTVVSGLPFSVSGRVALLGDSAHAMAPYQGAGAGQAMEDALILGRILSHPSVNLDSIPQALAVYQAVRLPFASRIVERSRTTGRIFQLRHPAHIVDAEEGGVSLSGLKALGDEVFNQWSWQWTTFPNDELTQAETMLEEVLSGTTKVDKANM